MNDRSILALAILGFLVAGLAIWVIMRWRRSGLSLGQYLLLCVNLLFVRVLWRTTINKPLPVAPGAGAIIVSNHCSSVEPLLIQLGTKRLVRWMVAKEYVEHWAMSWVFRTLECIPVGRRGVDTASTKMAIRHAREGSLVGVFPEGRINRTEHLMLPGRPGAALIALKAGAPVIPCYVQGSPYRDAVLSPFYTPARVRVTVGDPIDVQPYIDQGADRAAQVALTKRIMIEIAKLAGVENYQPEMAGRLWGPADDAQTEEDAEANDEAEAAGEASNSSKA